MKTIITVALLMAGTALHAQEDESRYKRAMKDYPVRFGVKAGLNAANITVDNAGNINDRRSIPAWHAGVIVDIPLLPVLSVQPGVLLNSKGAKYTVGTAGSSNYTEVSTRPTYLEVPVNAVVKLPLPNKVRLFAGAGPYIAYGIGGKNKLEGRFLGEGFSSNDKIDFGNDNPSSGNNGSRYEGSLKRFDMGFNLLAGIEISHLTLGVGYGHGLTNIRPGSANDNAKYQHRVGSVSVGFLF